MDTHHLGLSPEQQLQVDDVFVDTALTALSGMPKYWDRAAFVDQGDLGDELEEIHGRVYETAHKTAATGEAVPSIVIGLLGKLAFLDAMAAIGAAADQGKSHYRRPRRRFRSRDNRRIHRALLCRERPSQKYPQCPGTRMCGANSPRSRAAPAGVSFTHLRAMQPTHRATGSQPRKRRSLRAH